MVQASVASGRQGLPRLPESNCGAAIDFGGWLEAFVAGCGNEVRRMKKAAQEKPERPIVSISDRIFAEPVYCVLRMTMNG